MPKLNLGCGRDIKEGWINLDYIQLPGVDVVHDLNSLPLPFSNDFFDCIQCHDILEHVDHFEGLLKELHRILKKGGILLIRVPHFTSPCNFIDPTHKRSFSGRSFNFFTKDYPCDYHSDFHFEIRQTDIRLFKKFFIFGKTMSGWINWVERWINKKPKRQWMYEDTCFRNILPASNIYFELEQV